MAVYDVGMTMEEVMASGELEAPPDGTYTWRYTGLLKKDGDVRWPTQSGGKKVLAKLEVVSGEPTLTGKGIIYQGVIGSFSFSNLNKVVPGLMTTAGIDDEAGLGVEFEARLRATTYKKADGSEGSGFKLDQMKARM